MFRINRISSHTRIDAYCARIDERKKFILRGTRINKSMGSVSHVKRPDFRKYSVNMPSNAQKRRIVRRQRQR